jgi:hypothetical protein
MGPAAAPLGHVTARPAGDLDGDGSPDLLAWSGERLDARRGEDGRLLWSADANPARVVWPGAYPARMASVDVTGDGADEVAVLEQYPAERLTVRSGVTGTVLWSHLLRSASIRSLYAPLVAASNAPTVHLLDDVAGPGRRAFLVTSAAQASIGGRVQVCVFAICVLGPIEVPTTNHARTDAYVLDGMTGAVLAVIPARTVLPAPDLSGDGSADLLVYDTSLSSVAALGGTTHWSIPRSGSDAYGGALRTQHGHDVILFSAGRARVIDGVTGATRWTRDLVYARPIGSDVDGDGTEDLSTVSGAVSGATGAALTPSGGKPSGWTLCDCAADLTGDGARDELLVSYDRWRAYDAAHGRTLFEVQRPAGRGGRAIQMVSPPLGMPGEASWVLPVGDVDGDGAVDLAYAFVEDADDYTKPVRLVLSIRNASWTEIERDEVIGVPADERNLLIGPLFTSGRLVAAINTFSPNLGSGRLVGFEHGTIAWSAP